MTGSDLANGVAGQMIAIILVLAVVLAAVFVGGVVGITWLIHHVRFA